MTATNLGLLTGVAGRANFDAFRKSHFFSFLSVCMFE